MKQCIVTYWRRVKILIFRNCKIDVHSNQGKCSHLFGEIVSSFICNLCDKYGKEVPARMCAELIQCPFVWKDSPTPSLYDRFPIQIPKTYTKRRIQVVFIIISNVVLYITRTLTKYSVLRRFVSACVVFVCVCSCSKPAWFQFYFCDERHQLHNTIICNNITAQ